MKYPAITKVMAGFEHHPTQDALTYQYAIYPNFLGPGFSIRRFSPNPAGVWGPFATEEEALIKMQELDKKDGMASKVKSSYPVVEKILADSATDFPGIVQKLEDGETVTLSEAEYDGLIDYIDKMDHPYAMKLASLWSKDKPGYLDAFFKNLPKHSGNA